MTLKNILLSLFEAEVTYFLIYMGIYSIVNMEEQCGAVVAHRAHDPKVRGSNPRAA